MTLLNLPEADEYIHFVLPGGRPVEVIKNPTSVDERALSKEVRKSLPDLPMSEPTIRDSYDPEGNRFIWRADRGTHREVEGKIKRGG